MDFGLKLKENDLLMTENPGNPQNPMTTAVSTPLLRYAKVDGS